jgi:hypothetical protein
MEMTELINITRGNFMMVSIKKKSKIGALFGYWNNITDVKRDYIVKHVVIIA